MKSESVPCAELAEAKPVMVLLDDGSLVPWRQVGHQFVGYVYGSMVATPEEPRSALTESPSRFTVTRTAEAIEGARRVGDDVVAEAMFQAAPLDPDRFDGMGVDATDVAVRLLMVDARRGEG